MIVIGIDPDSDKHGVAVYDNGLLTDLQNLSTPHLIELIESWPKKSVRASIENVLKNNFAYYDRSNKTKRAYGALLRSIGRNQQAQQEIMTWLNFLGIEYELHDPSKHWKKDRSEFQRVTGWNGSSNEDTRSAAYFGFLSLTR